MLGPTIELANQISSVISRIVEYMPSYKLCNLALEKLDNSAHVLVSTVGQILNYLSGRSKSLDLSELRVIVFDDADCFILSN